MRVLMLRSFAGVLLFLSFINLCQGQTATPNPQLFYEDTTASQRVITQLAVDNSGNVISFTLQTAPGCGFGICGAVVYSIAPNGSLNWVSPGTNFIGNTVNEVAISSTNNIFFQDTFSLGQTRGLSASGAPLPNWPVVLGEPLDTFSPSLLIDPVDQSVFAKGGAASAFLPPLTRTASFQQDGTTKWIADFPAGADNTPGMLIGPNNNLYTFSDHTLLLDRNDGHTICEFPFAGGDSFVPITGGDGLVFSYTNTGVQRSDSGCIASPIYSWDTGRRGQLLGYDHGIVFAFDLPLNGIAGNPRFIAISKDGALVWHNDSINPLSIAGTNQGLVYVVGIDVNIQCCNDQKLFVLDEATGDLVSSVDITAICPACVKVAVGSNGVYVGDLSSTRIYKIDGLPAPPSQTPVVLVHGYCSAPGDFGQMADLLKGSGFIVGEPFDYSSLTQVPSFDSDGITIEQLAAIFAGHVLKVLHDNNATRVDVVAYSMGGLIARTWMAGLSGAPYKGEIHRLITIATPHYGAAPANLDFLVQALSASPLNFLFSCSATQAHEMRFGSAFIRNLHESWKQFETNSSAKIATSDLLFIAGTADDNKSFLNVECGVSLSLHGCNDDAVDISSAVLPDALSEQIRYVPYKHANTDFLLPLGGTAIEFVNGMQHKTFRIVRDFLKTGSATPQCCGAGTLDYAPPHLRGVKQEGLLVLYFKNATSGDSVTKEPQLRFVPRLLPVINYDEIRNKQGGGFAGIGIKSQTYDLDISVAQFKRAFVSAVQVKTALPTVIDPVLLEPDKTH